MYGVVHLIIAFTAVSLAFGDRSGKATQQGALSQLAEAAVGHDDSEGGKRAFKRGASLAKAVVYAALAVSATRKVLDTGGGGGSSSDGLTARLMSAPAGQLLVGLVGAGIVATGAYLAYKGWAEKSTKRLDSQATSGQRSRPILLLGKVGYLGKGAALAAVGGLFLTAAVQHQAKESGGLDVALQELLRQPFGPALVVAVAVAFACFGLYCLAWARHLDR